jgi:hypothetical protein
MVANENLNRERVRLEAQLQQLNGSLESYIKEESKKTGAEARYMDNTSQIELKYPDKKDCLRDSGKRDETIRV